MDKQTLFSIGNVADLFHISVSSLRHYEAIGLITPEYIDPSNGYRYYSSKQFEVLNSIRYLRALDMPLTEIADFLKNRDLECMEEKLLQQKQAVIARQAELKRIERKIDNRLHMIADARNSVFDTVSLVCKPPCRMVWVADTLRIHDYLDMEKPMRRLDRKQTEAVIFLGKVGLGISREKLHKRCFDCYDGVFLILDNEDHFEGDSVTLAQTLCASIRFRGSHGEASAQYEKLLDYITAHGLEITGFSREITMVDQGFTNDPEKFVTEISIPVQSK